MNQKFSKKELERLGCTEEEIKLVMDYQKKLPILINGNETVKYCVNIKELYNQLGVKYSLSRWIENNLLCNFIHNEDYEICFTDVENKPLAFEVYCDYSMQKLNYYNITKSYIITMNCAKEIAMIAGIANNANDELKENSKLTRKYFVLMERKIKENKEWLEIRDPVLKRKNIKICLLKLIRGCIVFGTRKLAGQIMRLKRMVSIKL